MEPSKKTPADSSDEQPTPDGVLGPLTPGGNQLNVRAPTTQARPSEGASRRASIEYPAAPGAKVAIPRAPPRAYAESSASAKNQRTVHACAACRRRKVKCGGERPRCQQCVVNKVECEYIEGKRDKTKRAVERIDEMEDVLRQLKDDPDTSDVNKKAIERILLNDEAQADKSELQRYAAGSLTASSHDHWSSVGGPADPKKRRFAATSPSMEELIESTGGENDITAAVGSAGSVDVDMEDHDRNEDTRATGMRGKVAVSNWLHACEDDSSGDDSRAGKPFGRPGNSPDDQDDRIASSKLRHDASHQTEAPDQALSYHQDKDDVIRQDPAHLLMPPRGLATQLIECYMATIHRTFVILEDAKSVIGAIEEYYDDLDKDQVGSLPWQTQAIANLLFAVGTNYNELAGSSTPQPQMEHLDFYNRARLLSMRGVDFVTHPNLAQIQILCLTSLYFMTIGQVNRAWRFSGMAINDATSLGLHLRNQAATTSLEFKQGRVRTWWALFNIDHIVCVITGRPSAISMRHCSVPLPAPYSQEMLDSTDGKVYLKEWEKEDGRQSHESPAPLRFGLEPGYLRIKTRITVIEHGILDSIYSATTASSSWKEVQVLIASKERDLETWIRTLPEGLRFELVEPLSFFSYENEALLWEKLSLAFSYYSAKCTLYRPCVCRIDARIDSQSQQSKTFNSTKANACVEAAKTMIGLLPDSPNVAWLYQNGPWWSLVDDLLRPASICLLELAMELMHMKPRSKNEEYEHLMKLIEKVMLWLASMALSDIRAKAAHKTLSTRWKAIAKKSKKRVMDDHDNPVPNFRPSQHGQEASKRKYKVPVQMKTTPGNETDGISPQSVAPGLEHGNQVSEAKPDSIQSSATNGVVAGSSQYRWQDGMDLGTTNQTNQQQFAPFAPHFMAGAPDAATAMEATAGQYDSVLGSSSYPVTGTQPTASPWDLSQGMQNNTPSLQQELDAAQMQAYQGTYLPAGPIPDQTGQSSDWMFPQATNYYGPNDFHSTAFDEYDPFLTLSQPDPMMGMPLQGFEGSGYYDMHTGQNADASGTAQDEHMEETQSGEDPNNQ